MEVAAYEGVVDHGVIRLTGDVLLPDQTRVFIVVPVPLAGRDVRTLVHIASPRLAHPEQAADFVKEVIEDDVEDDTDDELRP
jgi:hypothetical protein